MPLPFPPSFLLDPPWSAATVVHPPMLWGSGSDICPIVGGREGDIGTNRSCIQSIFSLAFPLRPRFLASPLCFQGLLCCSLLFNFCSSSGSVSMGLIFLLNMVYVMTICSKFWLQMKIFSNINYCVLSIILYQRPRTVNKWISIK